MARNKMENLRDHLFDVIERVMDDDEDFDLERAKAVNGAAKQLIDSAKVEVQMLRTVAGSGLTDNPTKPSDFFPAERKVLGRGTHQDDD